MKKLVHIVCILFCFSHEEMSAQTTQGNSGANNVKKFSLSYSCNFVGEKLPISSIYGFQSDTEASQALERIMKYTGLPTNFKIMAANVPNACAVIECSSSGKCDRFILYNQEFMMKIKNLTSTNWASISILAHEIGHHLSGHTLDSEGSRPSIELEADKFSGFVLAKMGATLQQAKIAMETLGGAQGSFTHPAKDARVAAIVNGWKEGMMGKDTNSDTPSNKETLNPKPQIILQNNIIQIIANAAAMNLMNCCSSLGGRQNRADVDFSNVTQNETGTKVTIPMTAHWYGGWSGNHYWIKGILTYDSSNPNNVTRNWQKVEDSGGFSPGCSKGCIY